MLVLSKKVKITFIFLIILCCTIIPGSAESDLEVWGYMIPGEVMSPGQDAYVQYTISFDLESDDGGLEFYTDLHDPKWQFTIVIDGVSQELPSKYGRYASIVGFELYYPKSHSSSVVLKLNGTVPEVSTTGIYTVFRVTQYDYEGSTVSEEIIDAVFVNPSEVDDIQKERESKLAVLRMYLDEKGEMGVYTESAEEKYDLAAGAIVAAATADSATASSLLSDADVFIDESYSMAGQAWAEFSIEEAELKIDIVEAMIREYEEDGVSDDSRVWVIMSYIDNANTLVVLAEDKFKMSDFSSAINYAGQAESKAETAYECAVGLNDELDIASPMMKVTAASTQSSVTSSSISGSVADLDEIIPDIGDNEEIGDIDDLLHSEVDIESTLKIIGLVADVLMGAFDFLSDLISMASDN